MIEDDTIKLLRECNSGLKMAVGSIDELLPSIQSEEFKQLLQKSKNVHEKLGNETHELLNKYHDDDKEPSPMAKAMSWITINMKMMADDTDEKAADIMTDGCNMGVKSLCKYLNKYKAADEQSKNITKRLIAEEEKLAVDIRPYL